jgi:sporulation protein YlmC with PRC-barrel domain
MKLEELKGRDVVAVDRAETLGRVSDVYLVTAEQRAAGLRINLPGLLSGHRAVLWSDLRGVAEKVTVLNADVLRKEHDVPELAGLPTSDTVLKSTIITDTGEEIGHVADIDLEITTGAVTDYVLGGSVLERLQHKERVIPVRWVKSIGKNTVVVTDQAAEAVQEA